MKNYGDLKIKDHCLTVGGCKASALAEKYGTPIYVFDVNRAVKTAKAYVDVLEKEYGDFTVCYASKTFWRRSDWARTSFPAESFIPL